MEQEQKRSSDVLIKVLLDEIKGIRELMEKRDDDAQVWREKFDQRLKPIEDLVKKLNTPFKVFTWGLGAVFVAILSKIGFAIFSWLERHFH